jgi:hypothetical protein
MGLWCTLAWSQVGHWQMSLKLAASLTRPAAWLSMKLKLQPHRATLLYLGLWPRGVPCLAHTILGYGHTFDRFCKTCPQQPVKTGTWCRTNPSHPLSADCRYGHHRPCYSLQHWCEHGRCSVLCLSQAWVFSVPWHVYQHRKKEPTLSRACYLNAEEHGQSASLTQNT